ncbi:MAG: YqgE/AlgH family protein [Sphingomonas sp.]|uniref:YqgE/AlgH family protein n=1 Tax=Sphingomonas sp. TaxID=28214 RepID=UPI00183BCA71|nr:YqgE/AlgH family protein [Sphingomonas sp.]MBA3666193.1 YqgE/AlgH family protein [Sphingomonas sp.]
MEQPRFQSGKLLLAMPGIGDPRFERAVIAVCVHDEHGAVGIGIGHLRAGVGLRGLLHELDIDPGDAPDVPVLHGGPVEPGRGFVLHSDDWGGQDTIAVTGLGALTGTLDVLNAIAEGRGPSRYLVALGYAGWGEGQLDDEMTRPGWLTASGSPTILFETPVVQRWEASFRAEGIDPRLLDSAAGAA